MRRALVVTDETARHPFLASLPPHVRRGTQPITIRRRGLALDDLRDFLLAYCVCFIAVSAFLI